MLYLVTIFLFVVANYVVLIAFIFVHRAQLKNSIWLLSCFSLFKYHSLHYKYTEIFNKYVYISVISDTNL